jgi:hypothetical protein
MSSKPHLAIYPMPISENQDIESLCGELVCSAKFGLVWDTALMGHQWQSAINTLNTCARCLRNAQEIPLPIRSYVYAIVPRDSKLGRRVAALEESA